MSIAATLSRLLLVSIQVLSSSAIQISWTLPEPNCFNFTTLTASCKSATQDTTVDSHSIMLEGNSTMATITGLNPDASYNCSMTSQLRQNLRGEFAVPVITYATELATTHPECELLHPITKLYDHFLSCVHA